MNENSQRGSLSFVGSLFCFLGCKVKSGQKRTFYRLQFNRKKVRKNLRNTEKKLYNLCVLIRTSYSEIAWVRKIKLIGNFAVAIGRATKSRWK